MLFLCKKDSRTLENVVRYDRVAGSPLHVTTDGNWREFFHSGVDGYEASAWYRISLVAMVNGNKVYEAAPKPYQPYRWP